MYLTIRNEIGDKKEPTIELIKRLFSISSAVKYDGLTYDIPSDAYLTTNPDELITIHLFYEQWKKLFTMEEFLNLKFIPKTENKYPIDVEQLWEYAKNGKQVGFNGGYYYIETITQDFYPNIPRLVVILFTEKEETDKWGNKKIERIEVTKNEDLDKISFPFY